MNWGGGADSGQLQVSLRLLPPVGETVPQTMVTALALTSWRLVPRLGASLIGELVAGEAGALGWSDGAAWSSGSGYGHFR